MISQKAQHSESTSVPDLSNPQHTTTTLATANTLCTLLQCPATSNRLSSLMQQSQSILAMAKQQSQALCNLVALSKELLVLTTLIKRTLVVPDQLPPKRHTPVPSNLRLHVTKLTIYSTNARVPNFPQLQQFPSTRHPETPYLRTVAPPWPHYSTVPFQQPAQKLKPQQTRMNRIPEKSSVVCGCQGMLWTKDNLRPP